MTVTEDRPTNQQTQAAGRVTRVTGPVVDVEFPRDAMPDLFNALKVDVTLADLGKTLTLEVAQHLGETSSAPSPWRHRRSSCVARR
jgi:F-type H+-transporting ATPase subunit beta